MNWIAILPAILAAVTGIALTATAVINSIKAATLDWPAAKMNMEMKRLELEIMRKKASQENVASTGSGKKPTYNEHAPPPKPSKVSKWFIVSLSASTLIYLGLLHYLTYTGSFSTYTLGFMFICVFWAVVNVIIFVHRLLENRINDESAWMRWVTLEMAHMQIHLTGDCFADLYTVAKLQTDIMEQGFRDVHELSKLHIDATADGFRDVHNVTKLQTDTIQQAFTGVTNVAKLQVHASAFSSSY